MMADKNWTVLVEYSAPSYGGTRSREVDVTAADAETACERAIEQVESSGDAFEVLAVLDCQERP